MLLSSSSSLGSLFVAISGSPLCLSRNLLTFCVKIGGITLRTFDSDFYIPSLNKRFNFFPRLSMRSPFTNVNFTPIHVHHSLYLINNSLTTTFNLSCRPEAFVCACFYHHDGMKVRYFILSISFESYLCVAFSS